MRVALFATAAFASLLGAGAATAMPTVRLPVGTSETALEMVRYETSQGVDFRRCMRAKYGLRYFSGVKRAHRYFMAQACGG